MARAQPWRPRAARWLERAAVHLFPARCFACQRPLSHAHLLGGCPECWAALAGPALRRCRHCALPLPEGRGCDGPSQGRCARCAVHPLPFAQAVAAVAYDTHARRFLLRAKNGHRPEILGVLAKQLAAAVSLAGTAHGLDGIVPVPSTPGARWRRGFNPAREIAKTLGEAVDLPVLDRALAKRGWGGPEIKALGARARWARAGRGIRSTQLLPGARVLLVDDVLTTGATAAACASALRSAGAVEVRIAVWARTPSPVVDFGGSRGSPL